MFNILTRTTFITAMLMGCVNGQLAMLQEAPWLGYFAVHDGNRYIFAVTAHGAGQLKLIDRKGQRLSGEYLINVVFGIEEMMPDGTIKRHTIVEESLVSDVSPSTKLVKSGFKGKTTGGAAFEVYLEQDRGIVRVGGRIVDRGQLTVNPVRFAVGFSIQDSYPYAKKGNPLDENPEGRKQAKAFKETIKDDHVALRTADGIQAKIKFEEEAGEMPEKIRNKAVTSAVVETKIYQDRTLKLTASPNSALYIPAVKGRPICNGFSIRWYPEPEKDPEGKARVTIDFR